MRGAKFVQTVYAVLFIALFTFYALTFLYDKIFGSGV